MVHTRVVRDWHPVRFFPIVESRILGAFLDSAPSLQLDLVPFWREYRVKEINPKIGLLLYLMLLVAPLFPLLFIAFAA